MCIRLDDIRQCDGQTDRRTELLKQYRALLIRDSPPQYTCTVAVLESCLSYKQSKYIRACLVILVVALQC